MAGNAQEKLTMTLVTDWTHIVPLANGTTLRIVPVRVNGRLCIDVYDVATGAKVQKVKPAHLTKPPK